MTVQLRTEGAIATIVLARPEARNALTEAMGEELRAIVADLDLRREIRAVVVRGDGNAFCAGGDLGFIDERVGATPADNQLVMRRFYDAYLSLRRLRVPTIAAVHGAAMGAGVCLALACDLRLAAHGTKLGLNFVRLGLHPGMGATLFLPRLVGPAKAAELLLTGRTIDADEALRIGLVNAVHAPDELVPAAITLAREIAGAAPGAVASTLRTLRRDGTDDLDAALDDEAREQAVGYASPDVAEGLRAARERRVPRFVAR